MKEQTIQWTVDHPEAEFSSRSGVDGNGNRYRENACREIVTCRTADGREGQGWTASEALANAQSAPVPQPRGEFLGADEPEVDASGQCYSDALPGF
jgi:hypothetical protein